MQSRLVSRGSLTIWFDQQAIIGWLNPGLSGKPGHPLVYTTLAITCMLTLKAVYHLPLRSTQGLTASLMKLIGIDLPVPHYSTLSRRSASLQVILPRQTKDKAIHLVVDSTGVKVYGEGEWKVRVHGYTRRRTWRKLHLGVDERSGEIVALLTTDKDVLDRWAFPELIEQIEGAIVQVSADGAYDYKQCYQAIRNREARASIAPRADAVVNGREPFADRDQNILRIQEIGRKQWKEECGYHRRSLSETTNMRMKTIYGERLTARRFSSQQTEMRIKCGALNRMTQLGMPESYRVA